MENKWLIITSDSPAYEATDNQLKQLIDHKEQESMQTS